MYLLGQIVVDWDVEVSRSKAVGEGIVVNICNLKVDLEGLR